MRFQQIYGNCGMMNLYLGEFNPDDHTVRGFGPGWLAKNIRWPGIIVFSDNTRCRAGSNLAAWIQEKKWGKVIKCQSVPNPNTGGRTHITAWLWTPNYENIRAYAEKHKIKNRHNPTHSIGNRRDPW